MASWKVEGRWWECCLREGLCPLWCGRDLTPEVGKCISLQTWRIEKGKVKNVDMTGVTIVHVIWDIGLTMSEWAMEGPQIGAIYIDHKTSEAQRKLLEPGATEQLNLITGATWKKIVGRKFVPIEINEERWPVVKNRFPLSNGSFHMKMPYAEHLMIYTVGRDMKNPIQMVNCPWDWMGQVRLCDTIYWKFFDYGKNVDKKHTSGGSVDFALSDDVSYGLTFEV